eukprot:652641-Pyramimonas_sp.AAC.2
MSTVSVLSPTSQNVSSEGNLVSQRLDLHMETTPNTLSRWRLRFDGAIRRDCVVSRWLPHFDTAAVGLC